MSRELTRRAGWVLGVALLVGMVPISYAVAAYGGHVKSIVAALGAVALSIITFFWATDRGLRHKVVSLLVLYLCIVIVFGSAYHSLFLWRPELFAFSTGIEEGRALQDFKSQYDQLITLNSKLYMLAIVQGDIPRSSAALRTKVQFTNPSKAERESDRGFVPVTEQCKIRLRSDLAGGPGAGWIVSSLLEIRYRDEYFVFGGDNGFDRESRVVGRLFDSTGGADFRDSIKNLIDVVSLKRQHAVGRLRSLVSAKPEWKLIDFIYFSAVTLTTLGYGDIVPNSSMARGVVLANCVVGVFFMAFALVFLWPSVQGEARGAEPAAAGGREPPRRSDSRR